MSPITFEHIYKHYGSTPVLKDLDLEIRDEEFLVLVGPSGCGKTTTLRCLAGFEEVSEGNIYIGERRVNDLHPGDRDIAMVFQSGNYALYPHMSVYDNLAFSLRLRAGSGFFGRLSRATSTDIDRRIRETANTLGIEELLTRKPHELSGGQRQRVALGRAIVRDPAVFLMDEPLSSLDARLRVQTRTEISKLHQRLKTTVIYVTHDQTEAMTMGTRIAVMREGVIQQIDTPQVLYDRPVNQFVAGFIGSPSMNFFEAKLERSDAPGSPGVVVRVAGIADLPLTSHQSAALERYIGQPLIFGIRPEDLHDPHHIPTEVAPTARVAASVSVTERVGSEVYVYLERNGKEFVGRFDSRFGALPGEQVEAVFDMQKMHLFDRFTEQTLT